ncbi:MAG: DNA mismatch repair protein MutS [Tissierellales bacterium]|jgi:DNA mismatch repair protein MutS|nr:DNA mismatch repair protein MutS [Tissierellales bacterium]
MAKLTPMMQQYFKIKEKYQDAILFFRLGDFYEMFFDDALTASKALEITLTARSCGREEKAPMCGVPYHSANSYIVRLIEQGYKVAICEQTQDPSEAKGIVERDVVRVITPGTIIDEKEIDGKSNNFLLAVVESMEQIGLSYTDITTGELYSTAISIDSISDFYDEVAKIGAKEIIINADTSLELADLEKRLKMPVSKYKEWCDHGEYSETLIKRQFEISSIGSFGLRSETTELKAVGMLLDFLNETQKHLIGHLSTVKRYTLNQYMLLDANTRRNLELVETIITHKKKGSLFGVLDLTKTAMGGRLLKKWIQEPLIDKSRIKERLDLVEIFYEDIMLQDDMNDHLKSIYDIERLIAKISYGNCNGRDLNALKSSLAPLPELCNYLKSRDEEAISHIGNKLDDLSDIYEIIDKSITDDPPITIKEGGVIKGSYDSDLAELKDIMEHGKEWLATIEQRERDRTGIKKLKIGYNKVFGYYLEATKSQIQYIPDDYIRKQTLSNAERYITPELKEMEAKILGAEEKILKLEYKLFQKVRASIASELIRIQETAKVIAKLDAINSLGRVAYRNGYVKPTINEDGLLNIVDGRHPVVETMLGNDPFVSNDVKLNVDDNQIAIITGPNMAGKSTYMRQVAVMTLLAQIGSFVPAQSADICIVDRIFTRIGASDDLSQGQSTFMVEMMEVANILHNCTDKSLLILDEIGRGTSTYDGLSIAWAVIEYISEQTKAKTLFATHYHELTELEEVMSGVKNYNITVADHGEGLIFLRKIERGEANKSYGIEVAKLAGVPSPVITKANDILLKLEASDVNQTAVKYSYEKEVPKVAEQLDLFTIPESPYSDIIEDLKTFDLLNATPLDAMNYLYSLKKKL